MHIKTPEVKNLALLAFPDFTGKTFKVEPITSTNIELTSYWNSGSRDFHVIVNLESNQTQSVPENGTPFVNGGKPFVLPSLPVNFAIVTLVKCRKDYILIRLNPENFRPDMLPAPVELTFEQKIVLAATRSLKSSYAGIKEYRFSQSGIDRVSWDQAKAELQTRGFLNKAGAITDEGRNAIGWKDLFALHQEKKEKV